MPLALATAPILSEAKVQSGPLRLSGVKPENRWKYVSKFGFAVGTGKYKTRLQLASPKKISQDVDLKFEVYLDEHWDDVEAKKVVCERGSLAKSQRRIQVKADGSWGDWVEGSLHQAVRPHIWYFALSDCSEDGTHKLANFTHRLKFEFEAVQESGSQFSHEMLYMLHANVIFLLGFTAFTAYFVHKTMQFSKSAGAVHPVIWTLCASMVLQYLAQVFHTGHLCRYSFDGRGVKALEVLSEILFILAQVTQTSLLILIALGYTLLQSKIGELDLMIPMCFMVGVIHIMLVGFGKIKDDASYKFHENEGVVGWILLVMRMVLYLWFLWAVHSSSSEGGLQLQRFLAKFRFAGSLYFLAYPMIFLVTKLFAPYMQHGVMSCGLMAMQMGSNVWLAQLFLTRGDYFKVSTLSSSDLPGGCKVGMVKEE